MRISLTNRFMIPVLNRERYKWCQIMGYINSTYLSLCYLSFMPHTAFLLWSWVDSSPSGAFISAYIHSIRGVWICVFSAQTGVYDPAYFQPKQGVWLLIFLHKMKRVLFVADFFRTKG